MPHRTALALDQPDDLDPLLERVGDARYVLIGEASHGTHEFYLWRAALTRRLIEEKGFTLIGVEGDWPDCYAVNQSVTLAPSSPTDPAQVLAGFDRWPRWMWANEEVVTFTRWLREHNSLLPETQRVGFFGLDVYSLWESLREVMAYLVEYRPEHAESAREAFRCFEPFSEDAQSYARATALVPSDCEDEVVDLLQQMQTNTISGRNGSAQARFNAEQNARTAAGAEAYYRAMVRGGPESWNIRDRHMVDTLEKLVEHRGKDAKAVVWAHNTHVGDARWTDMAAAGMVNVGQLLRQTHLDDEVVIVGLGSHRGNVIASDHWGGDTTSFRMPSARPGSVEDLLHDRLGDGARALFVFDADPPEWATRTLDHRAVGVVYDPEREVWGNYVPTVLGERYDAFLWFDQSIALTPLHGGPQERGRKPGRSDCSSGALHRRSAVDISDLQ